MRVPRLKSVRVTFFFLGVRKKQIEFEFLIEGKKGVVVRVDACAEVEKHARHLFCVCSNAE